MRRMSARSPQFTIVGLFLIGAILCYNIWIKSTIASDLHKENERLQTEIKLSAAKQVDYEQKAYKLHSSVSDVQEQLEKAKKDVENEKMISKDKANIVRAKETEIFKLKNEIKDLSKNQTNLKHQIEEKETEIMQLRGNVKHLMEQKNDIEEHMSDRDRDFNKYKMLYEQAMEKLKMDGAKSPMISEAPSVKIEKMESKEMASSRKRSPDAIEVSNPGYNGLIGHGIPLLPLDPPNAVRASPKFSVQDIEKKSDGEGHQNQIQVPAPVPDVNMAKEVHNVIQSPDSAQKEYNIPVKREDEMQQQQQVLQKPILPLQINNEMNVLKPPQKIKLKKDYRIESNVIPMPNLADNVDNPDRAIDEEEQVMEDPGDDQDEEGKDIKNDLDDPQVDPPKYQNNFNQIDYEDGNERNGLPKNPILKEENPEPRGIGKMEIPHHKEDHEVDDYVNVEGEADPNMVKANDHLFESNIKKLRNIRLRQ